MSEWVNAHERLPKESGTYLVYVQDPFVWSFEDAPFTECSYVTTATYYKESGLWQTEYDVYYCADLNNVDVKNVYYISHWMTLPKGPYGKKE